MWATQAGSAILLALLFDRGGARRSHFKSSRIQSTHVLRSTSCFRLALVVIAQRAKLSKECHDIPSFAHVSKC